MVDGFSVVHDTNPEFDFDPGFRDYVTATYFNAGKLQPEKYDVFPPDRERARDVVHYAWTDDGIVLFEHDDIAIAGRTYCADRREYERIALLHDERVAHWLSTVLALVPPAPPYSESTVGINLFRTRTSVVSGPHQDDEQLVLVYVVGRQAEGGDSYLYPLDSDEPLFTARLEPGHIMIFDDKRFRHSVSPLFPSAMGDDTYRDAIICTINNRSTYPFEPIVTAPRINSGWLIT